MADSIVDTVVTGGGRVRRELTLMDLRVDAATRAALKTMQSAAKRNIRSRMRGRPRWDHRGASSRTGAEVDLNLSPHHVRRTGGPGRLTGELSRHVGGVRRIRQVGREFHGGVGAGGGVTNLYRRRVEAAYPYFEPGVKATEAKSEALWEAAWAKATRTK